MKIEDIRERISAGRYVESAHSRNERQKDNLTLRQVEEALLSGELLEYYADTGRGESCLVLGFSGSTPIHVVCGWSGKGQENVVLITVYIPGPPKFSDPRTRSK